jgi:ribonucleotide reductase alpha subunit
MLKTGEPGFSVDTGKNSKEVTRNAPICGDTYVLTSNGYQKVKDIVNHPNYIWTGIQWAPNVIFKKTNDAASIIKVNMTGGRYIRCDKEHPFFVVKGSLDKHKYLEETPARLLRKGDSLYVSLPALSPLFRFSIDEYYLGYMYGDGSFTESGGAEITFCTNESKECAKYVNEVSRISSINKKDGRGYTRAYFKTDWEYFSHRRKSTFPEEVYEYSPDKIVSFIAGLFDSDGNYEKTQHRIRLTSIHKDFLRGVARLLESIGILSGISKGGISTFGKKQGWQLVIMGDYVKLFSELIPTIRLKFNEENFKPYRKSKIKVLSIEDSGIESVYCADVGMPEHSFQAEGIIIGNCTELTSADDSDVCNLGSINLSRINSLEEFKQVMELAIPFLLAGTVYSDVPYSKVDSVRTKNRRLGLGLMGIHEWLLTHGKKYGPDSELEEYLKIYATSTEVARRWAKEWELTPPVKTRAIAPNGTIGILAETTTGLEPILFVAAKRRYAKGNGWSYQYIIDPTAKRLIDSGIDPDMIEDAYTLAENPERRVAFQMWVQQYVDHGISSTINLPAWGTELNNEALVEDFGNMLIKYLPNLRGITCYPEGGRSNQPISPCDYNEAIQKKDIEYNAGDACELSKGESCGS